MDSGFSRALRASGSPALARSFGVAGHDGDLEAALAEPGPALVRIAIDPQSDCLPMFRPGGASRDMIGYHSMKWSGSR